MGGIYSGEKEEKFQPQFTMPFFTCVSSILRYVFLKSICFSVVFYAEKSLSGYQAGIDHAFTLTNWILLWHLTSKKYQIFHCYLHCFSSSSYFLCISSIFLSVCRFSSSTSLSTRRFSSSATSARFFSSSALVSASSALFFSA